MGAPHLARFSRDVGYRKPIPFASKDQMKPRAAREPMAIQITLNEDPCSTG
jgi:hypothetical protein